MTQVRHRPRTTAGIVYAALLPALLTLVGIGITATTAWHNQALWHAVTVNAARADADDYVQGLAKRGIAPHQAPLAADDIISDR